MNKFIERLKELLNEKEKTNKEIAKEIGLTPQKLNNYKMGVCEPNIDTLIIMANYFNVCIDYLVGRQDYM